MMKISHIVLRNFRRYEHARFNFHPHFSVLIGNNGAGKTTVLDALAIMLNTYFQGSKIATGGRTIRKDDARLVMTKKADQVFREPQTEIYLLAEATVHAKHVRWRRDIGDRGGKAKNLVEIGTTDRALIASGVSPDLPLLLYYGAGRLWDVHHDVETESEHSQLDAYRFCLDPKSDQKAFEKWFKRLTFGVLQRGVESKGLGAVIGAVKDAVIECVPGALDFFYDTYEEQIMLELKKEGVVPFNCLSDGYRNMVAMVADIAHRASRLNPHHGAAAAKLTSGVVLIDELDLHLHPKWQRRVVADLKTAFPNLQFVSSTHSPFILQSLGVGEVIDLDRAWQESGPEGGTELGPDHVSSPAFSSPAPCDATELEQDGFEAVEEPDGDGIDLAGPVGFASPGPSSAFSNRSIEDIAEGVMGVEVPQRSQRSQDMYKAAQEFYRVLEAAEGASEERVQELKQRLDELSAPFSDNVAYFAFLEVKRLAAGLGSSTILEGEQ